MFDTPTGCVTKPAAAGAHAAEANAADAAQKSVYREHPLLRQPQSLMTTLQLLQVLVMHHSLQPQLQRVMTARQRGRVIVVVVQLPPEVAVAMEWRDLDGAVVGAVVAGAIGAAVVVAVAVAVAVEAEVVEVPEPRYSKRTVVRTMILQRPPRVHSAASCAAIRHSAAGPGTTFRLSYRACTTRRRCLYPSHKCFAFVS